jgi:hypothetical protein
LCARDHGTPRSCATREVHGVPLVPEHRDARVGIARRGAARSRAPQLIAAILDEIPVSGQLLIETTSNGPPNVREFAEQEFKKFYVTRPCSTSHKGLPILR